MDLVFSAYLRSVHDIVWTRSVIPVQGTKESMKFIINDDVVLFASNGRPAGGADQDLRDIASTTRLPQQPLRVVTTMSGNTLMAMSL